MNKRPSSNLSGRLVPIFANNKKKRLKQALYANPTGEELESSSALTEISIDSCSGLNGDVYNESNKMGPLKQNFAPAQRFGVEHHKNSFSATPRQSATNCPGGFANRSGLQNYNPLRQQPRSSDNTDAHTATANTSLKNLGISPHFQRGGDATNFSGRTVQSSERSQQQHQMKGANLKEGSTKQVNLLATPQDRSLKVITASIQDLLRWKQVEDKMCVIYEVFGTLDSQVSLNQAGNGKNFVLKDKTGTLRCTFWEMDRHLPRLTRGQMHRCVGSLDRKTGHFKCVSVRPVMQTEHQQIEALLQSSYLTMQEKLAILKED